MPELADEEKRAIAACRMSWESLPDDELAAAMVGATFDAAPRIRPENKSYRRALALHLISEDGRMHDLVFRGLCLAAERLQQSIRRPGPIAGERKDGL